MGNIAPAALAIILLGLAAYVARRDLAALLTGEAQQGGSFELGTLAANLQEETGRLLGRGTDLAPSFASRNLAAFLAMIRHAEGTSGPNGYRTMFGGQLFTGWADHPRIAKRFQDRKGRLLWTTAAGAYQFLAVSPIPDGSGRTTRVDTWDRLQRQLGLPDFSPASQDRAAVELIDQAGALDDVQAGRFIDAVAKVRGVWASLPGAGYAQPERSIEDLAAVYSAAGGAFA